MNSESRFSGNESSTPAKQIDGNADEREQLRHWAKRTLTDHRHLKHAENGFARIENEATENPEATR